MAIVGCGNMFEHHKYRICPKCGKKGWYKPKNDISRDGKWILMYPEMCRICKFSYSHEIKKKRL